MQKSGTMIDSKLLTTDGQTLHVRHWYAKTPGRARGTVLILHGLGEHGGRYEAVAQQLNAWGWHALAYDARGHGLSTGPRGEILNQDDLVKDLALAIDLARSEDDGTLVLLGHSVGGLTAARLVGEALEKTPAAWFRPVDGLALSSPALGADMSAGQKKLLESMMKKPAGSSFPNGLKPEWRTRDPDGASWEKDELKHQSIGPGIARFFLEAGPWVRERAPQWPLPTLLMYAGTDKFVSPEGSKAFEETAPKLMVTAQCFQPLYHDLFSDPEKDDVYGVLRAWLSTQLKA
jgi:alpha-beta hydrolase superfamily lysophospholipase